MILADSAKISGSNCTIRLKHSNINKQMLGCKSCALYTRLWPNEALAPGLEGIEVIGAARPGVYPG